MASKEYLQAQEAALGPDDYDREFRAVFTAGGASFIEPDRVRACVGECKETLPGDGTRAGGGLAGLLNQIVALLNQILGQLTPNTRQTIERPAGPSIRFGSQ